jgi:sirohydrochlorin cobaltochelatase
VLPFRSVRAVRRLATTSVGDLIRLLRPSGAGAGVSSGQNAVAGSRPARRTRGVVVVGHGTADPVGAEETRQVAALVAGLLPEVPVELGFLEVIGPSIGVALERLAERGCGEVVAAPLLLFTAGHARRDVPEAVRDGAAKAGLVVRQSEALGCHPAMLALARQRRQQAVERLEPMPAEDTVLLMIGRGSSDPTAHRQLHDFALATCPDESEPPTQARIELGFVAAARPTLAEAVANAAGSGEGRTVRRVIVQPHLLFRGHVEEQVTAAVDRGRREHPGIQWVQVERLGADPLVARAVVDRAAAVMASCGEVTA